jgi:hypothetical protein
MGRLDTFGCVHVGLRPSDNPKHLFLTHELRAFLEQLRKVPEIIQGDMDYRTSERVIARPLRNGWHARGLLPGGQFSKTAPLGGAFVVIPVLRNAFSGRRLCRRIPLDDRRR